MFKKKTNGKSCNIEKQERNVEEEAQNTFFPDMPKQNTDEAIRGNEKLSKKEQRMAARELARKKKEIDRQAKQQKKSAKALLREEDNGGSKKDQSQKKVRRAAKNIYDYLGFNLMYEDGTCEVEEGLFSQTIEFTDISYQSARTEDQKVYFNLYSQVFDYCGPEIGLQINVINTPLSQDEIGRKKFFDETNPETAEYAIEYNQILNRKMQEGVSNLVRDRYLTISIKADTYEKSLQRLARTRNDLMNALRKLGCEVRQLDGRERLELIASQTRPGKPFLFEYSSLLGTKLTAKDAVCPSTLDFKPSGDNTVFKTDGVWGQVLCFKQFGSQLTDNALSEIIDLPFGENVVWHTESIDKGKSTDFVKSRLGWIDKEIVEYQQKAVRKGYDYQLLPQELAFSKNEAEELLQELQYNDQRLYLFTGLVYTYAETYEKLQEQAAQIISTARRNSIEIDVLDCQQKIGLNSVIPVGHNHMENRRYLTTAQTTMLIPFATLELNEEGGGYYGQNKVSSNLILKNRKTLAAPMGFVLGKPGSGKSFAVKREITNTYLQNPNDEFIIIDPKGEYPPLVNRLKGTVVNLSPSSSDHINLFDIYAGIYEVTGDDPTLHKAESVLAIASEVVGAGEAGLTPEEKTLIDRCVGITYKKFHNSSAPPKLGDFYETLKEQKEDEAKSLVTSFEMYVEGSLSYFNHHTTVDIEKRITSFSFKQLGDEMRVFSMLVILDFVYNRMIYNYERGVTTWLYIDEVQSLFNNPAVLAYFDKFWAEGRSYGLIPTGITQTVERVIKHDVAKLMLNNSDFLMLLKQSDQDRHNLSNILGLSPQQEEYIGRTIDSGEGLLICGSAVVPFKDNFPKGKLYDLWNTKPTEIAELKRAQWLEHQTNLPKSEESEKEVIYTDSQGNEYDKTSIAQLLQISEAEASVLATNNVEILAELVTIANGVAE